MERKVNTVTDAFIPAAAGTLQLLNGLATGDDYNNREGRRINICNINSRIFIFPNSAATSPTGDIIRYMIIYDNQPNGAAPAVLDILETANMFSFNNLNNRERFLILKDSWIPLKSFAFAGGALTTGDPGFSFEDVYLDTDLTTTYSGTGSTIASIQNGSLYLLLMSYTETYYVICNTRIRYTDP